MSLLARILEKIFKPAKLSQNNEPMNNDSFLNNLGFSFNPNAKSLILDIRYILSRAAKIKVELIHPNDCVYDLFSIFEQEACVLEIVLIMQEILFFDKYNIDIKHNKIQSPDEFADMTVVEFIKSVLENAKLF